MNATVHVTNTMINILHLISDEGRHYVNTHLGSKARERAIGNIASRTQVPRELTPTSIALMSVKMQCLTDIRTVVHAARKYFKGLICIEGLGGCYYGLTRGGHG